MTTNQTFFDEYGELNASGRMLYAEAIRLNRLDELPADIYNHVLQSPWASAEIIDLYMLLEKEDYPTESPHPFFDLSEISIGTDLANIDQILERLKAEAILNPTYEKVIQEQFAYRSSSAATLLKIVSPKEEQLITDSFIDFEWETNSDKNLILTLENHHRRLVKERLSAGTTSFKVQLTPKENFPSGLYYWKLALRGGKPVIGKIYIYNA